MKQAHAITVQVERRKLTQAEKDEIADRMELRLGKEHFIQLPPKPIVPTTFTHHCNKCGPTTAEGYWLTDNTGICEPCIKAEVAEKMAVEQEIDYHD